MELEGPAAKNELSAGGVAEFEPMRAELMRESFSIAGGAAGDARSAEALRGEAAIDRDHLRIRAPPSAPPVRGEWLNCGSTAARRGGMARFRALDVLELFAFVRPSRTVTPTIKSLSKAAGLEEPEDSAWPAALAASLRALARPLLAELGAIRERAILCDDETPYEGPARSVIPIRRWDATHLITQPMADQGVVAIFPGTAGLNRAPGAAAHLQTAFLAKQHTGKIVLTVDTQIK